jgi:predicted nucleic acid-binding protein
MTAPDAPPASSPHEMLGTDMSRRAAHQRSAERAERARRRRSRRSFCGLALMFLVDTSVLTRLRAPFEGLRGRKVPDLLIAAVAEAASLTVLHSDADFDHIAAVTGQPTQWIVERGSID